MQQVYLENMERKEKGNIHTHAHEMMMQQAKPSFKP
jgi:hypothetical protein